MCLHADALFFHAFINSTLSNSTLSNSTLSAVAPTLCHCRSSLQQQHGIVWRGLS